jgi:hypothetical protein
MIQTILGGMLGGTLRGIMEIAKSLITKKDADINYKYLFISIAVSTIVGVVASLMFQVDFKFAILAGYAGADFLETLYKMKLKSATGLTIPDDREDISEEDKPTEGFGELLEKMKQ